MINIKSRMADKLKEGKSMRTRNASPTAFGWEFQVNAGIVIMLDYIREAESIKIEGMTEDIEVILRDGTRVFAQAKSSMDPEDTKNASRDLKKALKTLNDADGVGKVKQLILVTNRANPLNEEKSRRYFSNAYSLAPYSILPSMGQQRIQDVCKQEKLTLRLNHFSVLALQYAGDGDFRYETIKERVSEFLVDINSHFQGFGKKILPKWQLQFGQNASQNDRSRTIKKKDMIWPLIVLFCEKVDDPLLDDFDDADREAIEERFADVIADHSERFDLVAKIMSEYASYKAMHLDMAKAALQRLFIDEKEELFVDEFALDSEDAEVAKAVRKLTIGKILQQRRKIAEVKEAVNL